jgi:hypothetical protein
MLSFKQHVQLDEGNPLARLHKHAQEGRHYVVISAHRGSDEATPEQNKKRHEELKKKLSSQGYAHKEVEGHWEGGKEKSIMVHAKDKGDDAGHKLLSDMKKHGEHYNQDAILHHDGKKATLHGTNKTGFPGHGKTENVGSMKYNKPDAPFQTEMKPKSDKPLKAGRTSKGSARFTTE